MFGTYLLIIALVSGFFLSLNPSARPQLIFIIALVSGFFLLNKNRDSVPKSPELTKNQIIDLILRKKRPVVRYNKTSVSINQQEAYFYNLSKIYELNKFMSTLPENGTLVDGDVWTATPDVKTQSMWMAKKMQQEILTEYGIDLEELGNTT